MFITIDLSSLIQVLPIYRDYIHIHLVATNGLKRLSYNEISELMVKMNTWDMEWYCFEEEYFETYHKKIRINIPKIDNSNETDEISSQLHSLQIFKAVSGDNPITGSPLPEHLAYLQSFYKLVIMNNQLHPDFCCEVRNESNTKLSEVFMGTSNRVVLVSYIEPVTTLRLRANSYIWFARGFTEYKIELTPEQIDEAPKLVDSHTCVVHNDVMKILIWNCRNAATNFFRQNFLELVIAHCPSLVIVTETKMAGRSAIRILDSIGFDGWAKVDLIGITGGIWVIWKLTSVTLKDISRIDNEIYAVINIITNAASSNEKGSSRYLREQ